MNSTTTPVAFQFQLHEVRTIVIDGEPWFVAADVCKALELTNSRVMLRSLDDDEKGVSSIYTPGGEQKMSVVSESGLYTLVLRCRDAVKAGTIPHRFRKWVTNEVLPAIRRSGCYQAPEGIKNVSREDLLESALAFGQWFMSVRDGRIMLKPIADRAMILESKDIAEAVKDPCSVSIRDLPAIIAAASDRLVPWVRNNMPAPRGV